MRALDAAGVAQYEISNFARAGFESRHNLKYWTRQPYLGFGVDAHSMLASAARAGGGTLFYRGRIGKICSGAPLQKTTISETALEEASFSDCA